MAVTPVPWKRVSGDLETSSTTGWGELKGRAYYNLIKGIFDWVESDA